MTHLASPGVPLDATGNCGRVVSVMVTTTVAATLDQFITSSLPPPHPHHHHHHHHQLLLLLLLLVLVVLVRLAGWQDVSRQGPPTFIIILAILRGPHSLTGVHVLPDQGPTVSPVNIRRNG